MRFYYTRYAALRIKKVTWKAKAFNKHFGEEFLCTDVKTNFAHFLIGPSLNVNVR